MIAENKSSRSLQRRARYCCYTYQDAKREYESRSSAWYWLDRELSSNLAGETGAVYIYKGALCALSLRERWFRFQTKQQREQQIIAARQFCETHHTAEESHRQFFDSVVPLEKRTRLLPVWRLAGYILGFLPTLVGGSHALYVTVQAVEAFVEKHFQAQIVPLRKEENVRSLSSCYRRVAKMKFITKRMPCNNYWEMIPHFLSRHHGGLDPGLNV